jgi:O-antigen ligase
MARHYASARYANAGPLGLSVPRGSLVVLVAAAAAGAFGFLLAQLGLKGFLVAAGGLGIVMGLLVVRQRSLLLLLLLVASVQVIFRKSFGPINTEIAGGPPAIYLNSVDVLLVGLFVAWTFRGTLVRDVSAGLRQRVLLWPLLGGLAVIPSLVMVSDLDLAVAELVRMVFGFGLFLYVGLRVRRRSEVAMVLGVLAIVALAQFAVTLVQWRTGSALGLDILGEASALTPRTLDDGTVPRPSGTAIHPVFLAALMGPIGLVALSLAIGLRSGVGRRLLWLLIVPVALIPLVLAQARSALIGVVLGGAVLTYISLRQGRLSARTIGGAALVGLMLVAAFWGTISQKVFDNLGTDQFRLEVESRVQLNQLALDIIRDHPIFGVGLNNFQPAMSAYDTYGMIYPGFPVHNLYLLIMAESGIIGLLGQLAAFAVLLALGWRLAALRDPLLSAVGAAAVAMYVFFYAEEMLGFSLRQDLPRTVFWLIAGLSVACWSIAHQADEAPRAT